MIWRGQSEVRFEEEGGSDRYWYVGDPMVLMEDILQVELFCHVRCITVFF